MNCIIIDDEPGARRLLEEYIGDIDFLTLVGKAENPLKASVLLSNTQVDLLFLDVNMPKMSGIEFLRSLPAPPPTILTTAYTEYAIEGFELDVLDYLVKPISFERFLKACHKAKEYHAFLSGREAVLSGKDPALRDGDSEAALQPGDTLPVGGYFFVKCDGRIEKVLYEELVYVEAMLNYIVLHTETRNLMVHLTMKGISEQLPGKLFLKVHKSTVVNIQKIKSIDGNEINLGKFKVVISQSLQEAVIREITQGRMLKR